MKTIEEYSQEQRNKSFASSAQLTLGEIIDKLEECGLNYGENNEPKQVYFDFCTAIPTTLDSWRGSYNELALGFKLCGYDNNDEHFAKTTSASLLNELKSAIGKLYEGWKGGEYVMTVDTPVWVDNCGNANNTAIIDVVDDGWRILIMTAYCKY